MSTSKRKSKVFVVSSSESWLVIEALKDFLESKADVEVILWNREHLWQPGRFIIETLLDIRLDFDFAISIFGADDKGISRGVEEYQPRDNVIFETGMFMSHLGKDRTFVLLPKDPPVKVLSDLAGFIPLKYEQPGDHGRWKDALRETCETIAKCIGRKGHLSGTIRLGPTGFLNAHQKIIDLLKEASSAETLDVKNIALDMEMTWPFIKNDLLSNEEISNVRWRSLMIDFEKSQIKSLVSKIGENDITAADTDIAANQQKDIWKWGKVISNAGRKERNFVFECKTYTELPILHGFLIGQDTLVLNMCNLKSGGLHSAENYIIFKNQPRNVIATDYITVFDTWFEYMWENSPRSVWTKP